jgi:hypothetical protein
MTSGDADLVLKGGVGPCPAKGGSQSAGPTPSVLVPVPEEILKVVRLSRAAGPLLTQACRDAGAVPLRYHACAHFQNSCIDAEYNGHTQN